MTQNDQAVFVIDFCVLRNAFPIKAELALDQMEADLLAQVRQYPDLTSQLKDVLNQARTRIVSSELE